MFDWLIKKGLKVVWKRVFGKDLTNELDDPKMIDSIAKSLEDETGLQIRGNWFDRLIDDINRLPRPIMTFGVIFLFFMAIWNPLVFSGWMVALQGIPTNLWYIMETIILFWFGGRLIEKTGLVDKTPQYAQMITDLKKKAMDKVTTNNFADNSKPLSQDAIEAWNREHNPNFKK